MKRIQPPAVYLADAECLIDMPQGVPTVIHGSHADPFQRYGVPYRSEITVVPVGIGDDIVQCKHLIDVFPRAGDSQCAAAIKEMLISNALDFIKAHLREQMTYRGVHSLM